MTAPDIERTLAQASSSIDACVIVGGTLITKLYGELNAALTRGVRVRFLFPVPDAAWLAPMIEAAGMTPKLYAHRIIENAEFLALLDGVEIRWYSTPGTSWFTVFDRKVVAHKPFSFIARSHPVLVESTEAADYYCRLFDYMWEGALRESPRLSFERAAAPERRLKTFLCHSSVDKPRVLSLYETLVQEGFQPWLDVKDLLPGQDWQYEIRQAIRRCDVIIVCLSPAAVPRRGYMQKELTMALDVADEQPQGVIFVMPVQLEPCAIPERLAHLHTVDVSTSAGRDQLLAALKLQAQAVK